MRKRKIIGLLTIIVGLSGLGGFWILGQLNSFPIVAKVVVFNSIFFKGICGLLGGILMWRGSRWAYYLTLLCWLYLILVSFLTLIQLYNNGMVISYDFMLQNYSNFGRPLLMSVLKVVLGIPIVHLVIKDLLKVHKLAR